MRTTGGNKEVPQIFLPYSLYLRKSNLIRLTPYQFVTSGPTRGGQEGTMTPRPMDFRGSIEMTLRNQDVEDVRPFFFVDNIEILRKR